MSLTTDQILSAFTEEITARGGNVRETFHQPGRLFSRSILALADDVLPKDRVNAGVALKAKDDQVWLHPYTFRQVCRNGAIAAHTLGTESIRLEDLDPAAALESIRAAIGECCREEVFTAAIRQMRTAQEQEADIALALLPIFDRLQGVGPEIFGLVLGRFFESDDRSQFGLMQAVTSVARDTADPEQRWDLEELGGAVAANLTPASYFPLRTARRVPRADEVLVG
jgi:hypothetical protein